jgi:hypothetical protein
VFAGPGANPANAQSRRAAMFMLRELLYGPVILRFSAKILDVEHVSNMRIL